MRRPSPIKIVVPVWRRPHAAARRSQNLTFQDVEAEADQHVEVSCPDLLQRFRRKTVDKLLPKWRHFDTVDARQHAGAVDLVQRVIAVLSPPVEAQIKIVNAVFPESRIE